MIPFSTIGKWLTFAKPLVVGTTVIRIALSSHTYMKGKVDKEIKKMGLRTNMTPKDGCKPRMKNMAE